MDAQTLSNDDEIFHTQSTYQNCTYRNHRNQIDTDTMTYTPGTYVPPHLRSKQKKEADPESQATTPATANLDPSAPVFKSSSVKSSSRTSAITVSTFAPSETKVQPLFDDLESATNFDFLYNKVKATTSSAASTVTPSQSNHSRSASIQPQLTSDRAQSPSNNSQASGKPTSSAGGRALATSFSQWASKASPQKKSGSAVQPKQAVTFTTPAKLVGLSHLGSSSVSQKVDQQSTTAHSPPPGLTASTSASHSSFEVIPMPNAPNTLLPASILPSKPQAAPVKLATSFAEFSQFRTAQARAPSPSISQALVPIKKMPEAARNGWPTKEESKRMKAKPLSDCIIDEDGIQGEIQNNDWPSDENSPELCLRQWDGDWLPAPVDWQGRRPYKAVNTFASDIATWIDRTNLHYLHINNGISKLVVNAKAEPFLRNEAIVENVPRAWIPLKVEGTSLQTFWQSLQQSSLQPVDEEDMEWAPYWLRYMTSDTIDEGGNDFQEPLPVPDAHLNPGDEDREMYLKGKSETAIATVKRIEAKAKNAAKRKAEWQLKRIKEQKKEARRPVIAPPPNPYKPAANIYLRPASHRDFDQMVHIYNHYVGTHYSSAMTPMTRAEMEAKKREVAAADMNMIVAVQKVKQNQTAGQRTNLQSTQEKIVGFAFTDEHEGRHALFRYTADLEVFVHPEYLGKGIGKSLVDRMLFLADSFYTSREAVEWRPMSDDLHLVTAGGKRPLGTVRINIFYPIDEEVRLVWIERWLSQFSFEKCGLFEGGIKLQNNVNMACFVHKNYQEVNPVTAYV